MLGIAVGCIGMSFGDFSLITPDEFAVIYKEWRQREDSLIKESWEQTRMLMWSVLAPYSNKHNFAPSDIPLPWDKIMVKKMTTKEREEARKEFEHFKKLWA